MVVSVGRLGDIFGRVRMYNAGFAIFAAASVALSVDPWHARAGAAGTSAPFRRVTRTPPVRSWPTRPVERPQN
jgi:hypothetical protein